MNQQNRCVRVGSGDWRNEADQLEDQESVLNELLGFNHIDFKSSQLKISS